jgi:integration host factor subunit alpha
MSLQKLNKVHLAEQLVKRVGVQKKEAIAIVEGFTELIAEEVFAGNTVSIHQFGVFSLKSKTERIGRNPKTGEEHVVPARQILHFCATRTLRQAVKEGVIQHEQY